MKKLIFIAAAFFLLPFIAVKGNPAGNPAESQSPSRPANVSAKSASQSGYISPTPGRFPIIAYSPVTDEKIPTKADFDTLKACGFNCAMTLFNHDEYYDLMGEIKDLGISFIPILDNYTNSRNYDGIKKFITDTRQFMYDNDIPDSLIGGYRIKDEPYYKDMDFIGISYNAAKISDPKVMPIVNLPAQPIGDFRPNAPKHAYSSYAGKRDTMLLYLNKFYETVHPDVLSYDYYPLVYKSHNQTIELNDSDFYYNLQLFALLSKLKGIPFWAFCQSSNVRFCEIGKQDYREHPVATENFLRYEAFSALAFGAKGINYWRYSDRRDDYSNVAKDGTYMLYFSALTDTLGHREPAWKCAQTVNRDIRKHEQMFLNAQLMSYSFFDSKLRTKLYIRPSINGISIPEYDGPIKIVEVVGKGILLSRIFDGSENLAIVNLDPFNPTNVKIGYDKDIAYTIMKRCDMVNHHNHELPTDSLIPIFHPINGSGDVAGTEISNESNTFVTQEIKLKPGGCSIVHYKFRTDERNSGMGKQ